MNNSNTNSNSTNMSRPHWRIERLSKASLTTSTRSEFTGNNSSRNSSQRLQQEDADFRNDTTMSTYQQDHSSAPMTNDSSSTSRATPGAFSVTRNDDDLLDESAATAAASFCGQIGGEENEWDPCTPPVDDFYTEGEVNVITPPEICCGIEEREKQRKRLKIKISVVVALIAVLIGATTIAVVVSYRWGRNTATTLGADTSSVAPSASPFLSSAAAAVYSSVCATAALVDSGEGGITDQYYNLRMTIDANFPDLITDIDTPLSTERLALCWIANFDGFQSSNEEQKIQRFTLALVYYHFAKTHHQSSTTTEGQIETIDFLTWNWLSNNKHECDWDNVQCSVAPANEVTSLKLNNAGLTGSVPIVHLLRFPALTRLDMSTNKLTGTISSKLKRMTQLEVLGVRQNQLSGPILEDVSLLSKLRTLDISLNLFTGTFPDLSSLTDLNDLSIISNRIGGTFPDLSASTNLGKLWFGFGLVWFVLFGKRSVFNTCCGSHAFFLI